MTSRGGGRSRSALVESGPRCVRLGAFQPEGRQAMATFVLVHGGGHGGWCYAKVAPRLREAGHLVYCPTLSGLADRAHLVGPEIDLNTHIEDVARLIFFEDLADVILAGHSYGGMVITGVGDRVPERIAHLVFLDAA